MRRSLIGLAFALAAVVSEPIKATRPCLAMHAQRRSRSSVVAAQSLAWRPTLRVAGTALLVRAAVGTSAILRQDRCGCRLGYADYCRRCRSRPTPARFRSDAGIGPIPTAIRSIGIIATNGPLALAWA